MFSHTHTLSLRFFYSSLICRCVALTLPASSHSQFAALVEWGESGSVAIAVGGKPSTKKEVASMHADELGKLPPAARRRRLDELTAYENRYSSTQQ